MCPLPIVPDHGSDNHLEPRSVAHRLIVRCLFLPLVTLAMVGTIVLGPQVVSSPALPRLSSKARRLAALRTRAFLHVWSLLGSYQGFDTEDVATKVHGLDRHGCRWVLGADAEELRSHLFPVAPGDRPGVWQSVDVMCPTHGRD